MVAIMARHKAHVEVIPVDYKYSFGNQNDAKTHRNSVQEYLFVDTEESSTKNGYSFPEAFETSCIRYFPTIPNWRMPYA